MDIFTTRELREHTDALIHNTEAGKLSLITKHGRPIFLAVPFNEELLELGLRPALAIKLYREETISLGKAAKLAGLPLSSFIEKLGKYDISVVNCSAKELEQEIKDFE